MKQNTNGTIKAKSINGRRIVVGQPGLSTAGNLKLALKVCRIGDVAVTPSGDYLRLDLRKSQDAWQLVESN